MKTIITDDKFGYLGDELVKDNEAIRGNLSFERFPDGTPNLFVDKVKDIIEHKDVTYIGDFSKVEDMFINYSTVRGLLDYYVDKLRIIMPYFPVGTMERIDTKGQVATAKYFADIMSNLPAGREGKTSIHILDIHAVVERFFFDSFNVNAEMHTALSLLKDEVEGKTLVFPDEGSDKRFGKDFNGMDKVICSKIRKGSERIVTIKEGNVKGKDLLIVDDLIQTGGTIIETADLLRNAGARSVSAYATHGVFPNNSHIALSKKLDKLIVTDSIPDNIKRSELIENLKILKIKPLIEKIIFRG